MDALISQYVQAFRNLDRAVMGLIDRETEDWNLRTARSLLASFMAATGVSRIIAYAALEPELLTLGQAVEARRRIHEAMGAPVGWPESICQPMRELYAISAVVSADEVAAAHVRKEPNEIEEQRSVGTMIDQEQARKAAAR